VKNNRALAQINCDYAILALPATLLRRIPITAALPAQQHEAIVRLKYGRATKRCCSFSKRFWRAAGRPRAFGSPLPFGAVWDSNEEQRGRAGISACSPAAAQATPPRRSSPSTLRAGVGRRARLARIEGRRAARLAADRVGAGSVRSRRLRLLRSRLRASLRAWLSETSRPPVLRRRAHNASRAPLIPYPSRFRPGSRPCCRCRQPC